MRYTPRTVLQEVASSVDEEVATSKEVASWAADKINELEQLLIVKDQQLRNARIRALKQEQRAETLKHELIKMSELI